MFRDVNVVRIILSAIDMVALNEIFHHIRSWQTFETRLYVISALGENYQ
jgi:hypothetical protein